MTSSPTTDHRYGAGEVDEDERRARRVAWLFACSVGVLVVGLVTVVAAMRLQGGGERASTPGGVTGEVVEAAAEIGPRPGADVAAYVRERSEALASAEGDLVAVVSLDSYATEAGARELVPDGGIRVEALFAAVPGGPPERVDGDMRAWIRSKRAGVEEERREFIRLLPTVTDAAFRTEYEAEVARLEDRLAEISPEAPLVFGLLVKGRAADLRALARQPGVRLVDSAPAVSEPERLGALRPEEVEEAASPPTRPDEN